MSRAARGLTQLLQPRRMSIFPIRVDPGTPLSYSVPGGPELNGGNRALEVSGNDDNAAWRPLPSAQSGDTVYISFLVRVCRCCLLQEPRT
jgi:hypothetical protein